MLGWKAVCDSNGFMSDCVQHFALSDLKLFFDPPLFTALKWYLCETTGRIHRANLLLTGEETLFAWAGVGCGVDTHTKTKEPDPCLWRSPQGTSLAVQWPRFCIPKARGPGSIPGQGTRSHMLHLRLSTAKYINIFKKKSPQKSSPNQKSTHLKCNPMVDSGKLAQF